MASAAAITRVIEEDARLSAIRETDAKRGSAPEAVHAYVRSMQRVDLRGCPPEFQEAYIRHSIAWSHVAGLEDKYSGLGGKVTAFLEGLAGRTTLEVEGSVKKEVEETWVQVQIIALRYGVQT